ncbi:hypothetical protein AB0I10_25575 [Streptomyces sp. NPDC050636]|uniref:hypothetical protein n=1 Tax=Streptomyces sp. NPDC050636 TaxID=3154510 RepID=UPI00341664CD
MGYSLGLFVQDGTSPSPFPQPSCGVTIVTHNGGVNGYGSLMYSTPDGRKTLTASVTSGDAAFDPAKELPKVQQRLVNLVFCGRQAGSADWAKPAQPNS